MNSASWAASLLRNCGKAKALSEGRRIHADMIKTGLEENGFLGNVLIEMYSKCAAPNDAHSVFARMDHRDVFCWTFAIRGYTQHGQGKMALRLFQQMELEGVVPNEYTFVSVLSACVSEMRLSEGKQLHAHIVGSGFIRDTSVANALVNLYGKCSCIEDAWRVFEEMPERNAVSWNAMIATYAQHEKDNKSNQLFQQLLMESVIPTHVTFISILSSTANRVAMAEGKHIHACIIGTAFESDIVLGNALINMYGKCGNLEDASKVFQNMIERDAVSWNAFITAYAQQGYCEEAIQLFEQMLLTNLLPNKITFVSILSACASQAALAEGKRLHVDVMHRGYESDVVVGNALINMYGKSFSAEDARKMFDGMHEWEVASFNAMIAAHAQSNQGKEALQVFEIMQSEGLLPNNVTFVSLLDACACMAALMEGQQMHVNVMEYGFDSDVVVASVLVNMYGKCGIPDSAYTIFHTMPERDVFSWNAIISAYTQQGQSMQALQLFGQMQVECLMPGKVTFVSLVDACASLMALSKGKQMHALIVANGFEGDVVVGSALVNMYGKCSSIAAAKRVFYTMSEQNVLLWTAMITAYSQNERGKEAVGLLEQMKHEGMMPNKVTFVSLLDACTSQAAFADGKQLHAQILASGFSSDIAVGNALISMYGKCGSLENAHRVFNNMFARNVISWTAIIAACGQLGEGKIAFKLFQQMQEENMSPNEVTFASILSACSRGGLLSEACDCFLSMSQDYGIAPAVEHYNCMVDLLGRMGQLEKAEDLAKNMLCGPSTASWMTLLGACRMQLDITRGEHIARHVFQLEPESSAPYVSLSNMYAAAGRWDDVARVRNVMKENDFEKIKHIK